jgi:hypothetical protein
VPTPPPRDVVFGLHLISEISTATQLLAVGLNQIVEPSWYASEPASALTCMSSGVERILKLTYGLSALDRGEPFPSAKKLRAFGHDLTTLDSTVRPGLAARSQTLGKAHVKNLLTDVDADPYWPGLLKALDAWAAAAGRYRDLTILTGEPATGDPPAAAWDAIERACIEDLGLLSAVAGADSRTALVQMRTRLALSILKWWHAIYRTWTHGLLGAERISPGTALSPSENRNLAPALAAAVKPL